MLLHVFCQQKQLVMTGPTLVLDIAQRQPEHLAAATVVEFAKLHKVLLGLAYQVIECACLTCVAEQGTKGED